MIASSRKRTSTQQSNGGAGGDGEEHELRLKVLTKAEKGWGKVIVIVTIKRETNSESF